VTVLSASGLTKRFPSGTAVANLNLTIPDGRIVGLVGPNGAGKSTLLRMAAGLVAPTSGELTVLNAVPSGDDHSWLARVGYLDQRVPLVERFTIGDMLRVGASMNQQWRNDAALAYLERAGLTDHRHVVGELSGGQRSQVAVAMVVGKQPDLFLLDEPAAALDPLARDGLLQALSAEVVERGASVVIATHALGDVTSFCDHVVVMRDGHVVVSGDSDELLDTHYRLITVGPLDDSSLTVLWRDDAGRGVSAIVRGEPRHDLGLVERLPLSSIIAVYLRTTIQGELS